MTEPATLWSAVLAAVGPAFVLALLFGIRDALHAVRINVFTGLPRYFWVYFALPIVALTALVLPPAVLLGLVAFNLGLEQRAIATTVAVLLITAFLAVEARAFLVQVGESMERAQQGPRGRSRALALLGLVLLAVAAAGITGVAIVFWRVKLPPAAVLALAGVNLLLLPPVLASAFRELRLTLRPRRRPPRAALVLRDTPSVVLISIDTLRADRLDAYGGARGLMPALDRVARRGVVFETAIAQSSWTLPSIASLLTGLNPSRHGAGWPLNGFDLLARSALGADTWTLAQGLQAAGYETHAVVANPYLALQYGLSTGFDSYENVSVESELLTGLHPTLAGRLLAPLLRRRIAGNGAVVTQRALHRLRQLGRNGGRPFFLWLHYIDPHAPYGCAGSKSFRGDTLLARLEPEGAGIHDHFEAIARLRAGEIRLDAAEKERLVALYDAGVADVDRQIGRVLDALGSDEHTLLVVASDHGEEFWEHGGVEHGHTFYEELVRVPLMLAGAGLPRGQRVGGVVRLTDVPSTVLGVLDLPQPAGLDGSSLATRVGTRVELASEQRVAVCEGLLFAEEKVAVRTARHKYVRSANGKEELYDLVADPRELRDIAAGEDPDWARALVAESLRAAARGPHPGEDSTESHAVRTALHALGYA